MTTKQKILEASLTLFAQKGYTAVSVGQIAEAVGIKAPSLYKHYKSKQDIFDAILAEMASRYEQQAATMQINGVNPEADLSIYQAVSEDMLVKMGKQLFLYFLHDEYVSRFRKMLTVEQYQNAELAALCSKQYADDPLSYQGALLGMLAQLGVIKNETPNITALHFYAPLYLLLTICDRQPSREAEALKTLEQHIKQFNKLYKTEG